MTGRILHLEDGETYARDLHARLEALGHQVVLFATRVGEALPWVPDAILEQRVNLVILDRDLPDGSGVHVAQAIRNAGLTQPIIANSGYVTDFGDYNVTKLQQDELLRTVSDILSPS